MSDLHRPTCCPRAATCEGIRWVDPKSSGDWFATEHQGHPASWAMVLSWGAPDTGKAEEPEYGPIDACPFCRSPWLQNDSNKSRYVHDCYTCVFLGQHGDADLYVHPRGHITVIARYSNDGSDYASGLSASGIPDLTEARRRAVERGVLVLDAYKSAVRREARYVAVMRNDDRIKSGLGRDD